MKPIAASLLVAFALAGGAPAAAPTPLDRYLDDGNRRFGKAEHLLGQELQSHGYHTTLTTGTWVHPVVPSLDYATGLLDRHTAADRLRAEEILEKVVSLQDSDPAHATYGIWSWFLEEPLAKMSPPDWNWADFCGARLAIILADHGRDLPDVLRQKVRTSLGHAARAIVKRNVGPGYTNIAIMGGGVCAAAGEMLGDAKLLEYGRQRLQGVVRHTAHDGSFNEYNSPTYTLIALTECERALHLVHDPATREAAESLRRTAWQIIAESFHPATCQWAGPHARAYSDFLSARTAALLSEQTGADIRPHSPADAARATDLPINWHLPCPDALRERFRRLPTDPYQLRRTFIRSAKEEDSTVGTTWLTGDACLGSINRGSFWTQCRPLIGYWRTAADPAVVLRMRFLHDGKDFASMGLRTAQIGGRTLSAIYALRGQGDWHPNLDRPPKGIIQAADFRLRIELTGKDASLEELGPGRWALKAGDQRSVVHAMPGRFAEHAVTWKPGKAANQVYLDAVCYEGPRRPFDFAKLPRIELAVGIEVIPAAQAPLDRGPKLESKPESVEAAWPAASGLRVAVPAPKVEKQIGT